MSMLQLGLFNNCNGACKFCLIKDQENYTMEQIYTEIERAIENIKFINTQEENFTNKYADGFSLLGGEIFFIRDEKYKELLLKLIDTVIEEVLKKSPNPKVCFSTVTNGFYDPEWLLFPVIDKIINAVGVGHVDVNFSYDLLYRFTSKEHEERVVKTINQFHERYNYCLGIQMILTQHLCDLMINDGWRPSKFVEEKFPGNFLTLLYPHPIYRGNGYTGAQNLPEFNFTRKSLFKVMQILKTEEPMLYQSFIASTKNSAVFKYTMMYNKKDIGTTDQAPMLSDGKEIINFDCGHSVLYQCYSDTDKCMLCDLINME